jgi:hypothetical protein
MSDIPGGHDDLPDQLDRRAPDLRREDGTTIADRVGRDPSNLGDEVPTEGDLTYPAPAPADGQI